jgi:hypothetical protein
MEFLSWTWLMVISLGIASVALGGLMALVERMKQRDSKI